ncbi:hypothetical protein DLAC_00690 [Tieghemostelium lacteum]|uniref:Uncharacterized protein n=1 Tax=Tieghemostelium lacteum TaxID=361077 RepID=A0A152A8U8_TIELA|nr:hypothetical protein DLAC_00690 [Tieghemostelium lacteum]|eukprot:KYR02555.1 hypothetical protein DLAC_00690 [Tieghemostelium lacteum]
MNKWINSIDLIPPQLEHIDIYIDHTNSNRFIMIFLQHFQYTLRSIKIRKLETDMDTELIKFSNNYHAPNLVKLKIFPYLYIPQFANNHFNHLKSLTVNRVQNLLENWVQLKQIEKLQLTFYEANLLYSLFEVLNEKSHLNHLDIQVFSVIYPQDNLIHDQIFHYIVHLKIRSFLKDSLRNLIFLKNFPSLRDLRIYSENDLDLSLFNSFLERHQQLVKLHLDLPLRPLNIGESKELSKSISLLPSLVYLSLFLYEKDIDKNNFIFILSFSLKMTKILSSLHQSETLDFIKIKFKTHTKNLQLVTPSPPFKIFDFVTPSTYLYTKMDFQNDQPNEKPKSLISYIYNIFNK